MRYVKIILKSISINIILYTLNISYASPNNNFLNMIQYNLSLLKQGKDAQVGNKYKAIIDQYSSQIKLGGINILKQQQDENEDNLTNIDELQYNATLLAKNQDANINNEDKEKASKIKEKIKPGAINILKSITSTNKNQESKPNKTNFNIISQDKSDIPEEDYKNYVFTNINGKEETEAQINTKYGMSNINFSGDPSRTNDITNKQEYNSITMKESMIPGIKPKHITKQQCNISAEPDIKEHTSCECNSIKNNDNCDGNNNRSKLLSNRKKVLSKFADDTNINNNTSLKLRNNNTVKHNASDDKDLLDNKQIQLRSKYFNSNEITQKDKVEVIPIDFPKNTYEGNNEEQQQKQQIFNNIKMDKNYRLTIENSNVLVQNSELQDGSKLVIDNNNNDIELSNIDVYNDVTIINNSSDKTFTCDGINEKGTGIVIDHSQDNKADDAITVRDKSSDSQINLRSNNNININKNNHPNIDNVLYSIKEEHEYNKESIENNNQILRSNNNNENNQEEENNNQVLRSNNSNDDNQEEENNNQILMSNSSNENNQEDGNNNQILMSNSSNDDNQEEENNNQVLMSNSSNDDNQEDENNNQVLRSNNNNNDNQEGENNNQILMSNSSNENKQEEENNNQVLRSNNNNNDNQEEVSKNNEEYDNKFEENSNVISVENINPENKQQTVLRADQNNINQYFGLRHVITCQIKSNNNVFSLSTDNFTNSKTIRIELNTSGSDNYSNLNVPYIKRSCFSSGNVKLVNNKPVQTNNGIYRFITHKTDLYLVRVTDKNKQYIDEAINNNDGQVDDDTLKKIIDDSQDNGNNGGSGSGNSGSGNGGNDNNGNDDNNNGDNNNNNNNNNNDNNENNNIINNDNNDDIDILIDYDLNHGDYGGNGGNGDNGNGGNGDGGNGDNGNGGNGGNGGSGGNNGGNNNEWKKKMANTIIQDPASALATYCADLKHKEQTNKELMNEVFDVTLNDDFMYSLLPIEDINTKKKYWVRGDISGLNSNKYTNNIVLMGGDIFNKSLSQSLLKIQLLGGAMFGKLDNNSNNYNTREFLIGPKLSLLHKYFVFEVLGLYRYDNVEYSKDNKNTFTSNILSFGSKFGININLANKIVVHPYIHALVSNILTNKPVKLSNKYQVNWAPGLAIGYKLSNSAYITADYKYHFKPVFINDKGVDVMNDPNKKGSNEFGLGVNKSFNNSVELSVKSSVDVSKDQDKDSNKKHKYDVKVQAQVSKSF